MKNVAVLVGSIRRESISRQLANAVEGLARDRMRFNLLDLASLPLYNDDLWPSPPEAVHALKREVEAADALLFVTPEYNRSIPPALKNAIDWGSRPWGKNSWNGKPGALIGVSPGQLGAAVALSHLRSSLMCLDVILMGQPEVYFSFKPGTLGADGDFAEDATRTFFATFVSKFDTWIDRTSLPKADTQPNG